MNSRKCKSFFKKRLTVDKKEVWRKRLSSPHAKISFIALTLAMGFLYVLQMNVTATKGYDIRELEQKIALLQKENRQLQLDAMELQSMERVVEQLPSYYLVEANADDFVTTTTTTVASK